MMESQSQEAQAVSCGIIKACSAKVHCLGLLELALQAPGLRCAL